MITLESYWKGAVSWKDMYCKVSRFYEGIMEPKYSSGLSKCDIVIFLGGNELSINDFISFIS